MGSLLYESEGEDGREAIKVTDPELADAFFVPFFSSLSFNTHGHNMTDPKTEIDHQLQVFKLDFNFILSNFSFNLILFTNGLLFLGYAVYLYF